MAADRQTLRNADVVALRVDGLTGVDAEDASAIGAVIVVGCDAVQPWRSAAVGPPQLLRLPVVRVDGVADDDGGASSGQDVEEPDADRPRHWPLMQRPQRPQQLPLHDASRHCSGATSPE